MAIVSYGVTTYTLAVGRLMALLYARGTTALTHYAYTLDATGSRARVTETVSDVAGVVAVWRRAWRGAEWPGVYRRVVGCRCGVAVSQGEVA